MRARNVVLKPPANQAMAMLIVFILGMAPGTAAAGSITVHSADSNVINQMLVISAEMDFVFSDDALEAMQSGVAL
ncbi:MAG: hypothetical protein QF609_11945, partial [Gammaproteobacteria bacterium]|nr:hypothetical protein [Gammaproteobacteria bacterium]